MQNVKLIASIVALITLSSFVFVMAQADAQDPVAEEPPAISEAALKQVQAKPSSNLVLGEAYYTIMFKTATTGAIKKIEMVFPAGFNLTGAKFIEREIIGAGGLSVSSQTLVYTVSATPPPNIAAGKKIKLMVGGVVNNTITTPQVVTVTTKDELGGIIDGPTSSADPVLTQIQSPMIGDGAVTTAKIADGAVTGTKIAPAVVGPSHIGTGAVWSEHISDGTVTNADLAVGSFSNIRGVGTLSSLAVSGAANLATTSGNVGIGTTIPAEKLEVKNGNIQITSNEPFLILKDTTLDGIRPRIRFLNNSGNFDSDDRGDQDYSFYSIFSSIRQYDARLRVFGKASGSWGKYIELTHNGTDGKISTDSGNLLLNPAGNVGIGMVTIPSAKLDANSLNNIAVRGETAGGGDPGTVPMISGVYGYASNGTYAENAGGYFRGNGWRGYGVFSVAQGTSGTGVYARGGQGDYGIGVEGWGGSYGGFFQTPGTYGTGVYGKHVNTGNYGYLGGSDSGVFGYSSSGFAGNFSGDINVTGNANVSGNINIAGTITSSPKTGYYSVPAAAFQPRTDKGYINNGDYIYGEDLILGGPYDFVAPVNLPHGATITKVVFYWSDGSEGSPGILQLLRMEHATATTSVMAQLITSGSTWGVKSSSTTTITNGTIDNSQYTYYSDLWTPDRDVWLRSIRIEYTYSGI